MFLKPLSKTENNMNINIYKDSLPQVEDIQFLLLACQYSKHPLGQLATVKLINQIQTLNSNIALKIIIEIQ